MNEENPEKPIEVWYQDESRIGQQGALGYIWGEKGKRNERPKQQGFLNTYYYGAIEPVTGNHHCLIMPYCNGELLELFLTSLSEKGNSESIKVIICDQAGWHVGGLKIPKNIVLFHLPPYSPQLNPIERVWQFLKQRFFKNRIFETYDDLLDVASEAWNSLDQRTVRSISESSAKMA